MKRALWLTLVAIVVWFVIAAILQLIDGGAMDSGWIRDTVASTVGVAIVFFGAYLLGKSETTSTKAKK